MTVVAIESVVGGKALGPVVSRIKRARHFRSRQSQASVVFSVTVGAGLRPVAVSVVSMSIHPGLTHGVDSVRAAVRRCGKRAGMTGAAFRDFRYVSLQRLGIDAVIRLQRWIFRVRRTVTTGAENRPVSLAEAIQIRSRNGNVRVGGKGGVAGLTPLPAGEGCAKALAADEWQIGTKKQLRLSVY